jgi:hypothetical protein
MKKVKPNYENKHLVDHFNMFLHIYAQEFLLLAIQCIIIKTDFGVTPYLHSSCVFIA